jgi:hypothetical protein
MTEIIGDMLSNPTFDTKAIDAEKSTIIREAEAVAKDKSETLFDHLHAVAFQGERLFAYLPILLSSKAMCSCKMLVHRIVQDNPSVTTSSARPLTSCP